LLGLLARAAVLTFATAITAAVFVLAFKVTTARELSWRQIAPGALTAAVLWQLLQWGGGAYVGHVVKSASATNSVFALVLGLLAFFYLISVVILLCAEVNVVVTVHLYPRALLAPFTDAAALTPADQKTYAGQAKAQRVKDCQDIDVSFEIERPDNTR
jgi:uncharacterized BrkB/YihY/UPF0761 family membrane protein